ncbi:MAG: hypothetical protein E7070_06200 [Bacteroidales bacterium]|jgi:hypothetical protein|nr:hypothetical protein [Bacteroidales bacterium]
MKNILLPILLFLTAQSLFADAIDSLKMRLQNCPIQEKIYIHTDNNSYFVGDTIWYKAYVLRADDHKNTDMSKIAYVELLTSDGYLVERQKIIVEGEIGGCGQFIIPDTLYSGYYELRAYTRWQLNFNHTEKPHGHIDDMCFFNPKMASIYFRDYDGLFSRVIPIYEKPRTPGNYVDRWIRNRPLRRIIRNDENGIDVKFYPEGGNIVSRLKNNVAFEVLDKQGKPLMVDGILEDGTRLRSDEDGRGMMVVSPTNCLPINASFSYQGEQYCFQLPQPIPAGGIISYNPENDSIIIQSKGVRLGAVAAMCRGRLVSFDRLRGDSAIGISNLPTGVNEITLYDENSQILAKRHIFINHNDCAQKLKVKGHEDRLEMDVAPFKLLTINVRSDNSDIKSISVSVCDDRGDIPSYDDGNMMTNLLLESDLRGFVAHPSYYFESDDFEHKYRLNLLMMIQGWERYSPLESLEFLPEKNFLFEGEVFEIKSPYMTPDLQVLIHDNCSDKNNPCFFGNPDRYTLRQDLIPIKKPVTSSQEDRTKLRIESEICKGKDIASITMDLDSCKEFAFQIPSFFNEASLFMTAYELSDSSHFCLASRSDSHKLNPLFSPYYYIKRENFYPHYSKPYDWRQTHYPEDDQNVTKHEADKVLDNVLVQSKQRIHVFNKDKPLMVIDFLDLINRVTDDGLYWGAFNGFLFWGQVSSSLFGNMNTPNRGIKVRASVQGHDFLKIYTCRLADRFVGVRMTPVALRNRLLPCNIWKVKVYSDYNMRDGIGKSDRETSPDVWFDIVPFPDNASRTIWRDRMMLLDGFAYPKQFYNRSYADSALPDSADYRRTLYWNPNVHPDKDGNINIQFYNGARPAHLKVTICGVSDDGQIYYY